MPFWQVVATTNWGKRTIWFTKCPKTCRTKHQNITFKTRKVQAMKIQDKGQHKISKELDLMNLEDLLEYIQPFTHLLNKKKFEKLPE